MFIANRLRISYLAAGLRRRVQKLLNVSRERRLTIHPGDVRDAYALLPVGRWLLNNMVNAIAVAEKEGLVHPNFLPVLQGLYAEMPNLRADVEQRKSMLG